MVIIDIDGTLIPESLEKWFLKFLMVHHYTSQVRIVRNLISLISKNPFSQWYELKAMYLRGFSEEVVRGWICRYWEEYVEPKLFMGIVAMVQQLQMSGAHIILLSGTLCQLAEPLAHYLHIADLFCAEPEIENGVYTGSLRSPHARGRNKVRYAERLLHRYQYRWSEVCVVADHWADRFLLEQARHGVVIKPHGKLRNYARRRNWFVIDDPDNSEESIEVMRKALANGH